MFKTILCGVALLGLASAVPAGSTIQATSPVKCVGYEFDYYEEIGCKSEAVDERGCPSSYDCSSLANRAADKCYFKGQPFDVNAKLPEKLDCRGECSCLQSRIWNRYGQRHTNLQVTCPRIECPELFDEPPIEGCHHLYEHGKCCPTKEVCPTQEERRALHKCEVDGNCYIEGEKFYPENEQCVSCICHQNYSGANVAPYCERIQCNYNLYENKISKGCIPVYYGEKGCCPIDWLCPKLSASNVTEETRVEPGALDLQQPINGTAKTCKFGDLTMNIGDTKSFDGANPVCKCRVPPHPICIMSEGLHKDKKNCENFGAKIF